MSDPAGPLARLIRGNVEFVVVGGYAAVAHGAPLPMTRSIGICCDFSADNLLRLQAALSDLHPVHRMSGARPPLELTPDTCGQWKNLYLDTDMGQLDCVAEVTGVGDFEEAKRNSVEIELDVGSCRVLSLDALIRSKDAMDRPRDREAVMHLKAIRERLQGG